MARIAVFGFGIAAKSPYVTAKYLQNIYCEQRPSGIGTAGEKSMLVGDQTPGLNLFADFGATPPRGGIEFEPGNVAYVVHRGVLWEINNAGVATNRGTLLTTTGRVSLAHNGVQVMIVDWLSPMWFGVAVTVDDARTWNAKFADAVPPT